eukprot:scaffold25727_cov142-Cylindrotheca_fusiformis.AAC.5
MKGLGRGQRFVDSARSLLRAMLNSDCNWLVHGTMVVFCKSRGRNCLLLGLQNCSFQQKSDNLLNKLYATTSEQTSSKMGTYVPMSANY